ncbi:MAG: D-glycerate 3-kinase [Flavobacteriaceae bacterium]|jgi:D-glycerate 3-kinase
MITPALQSFINRHRLPESYLSMAEQWFSPIISEFGERYERDPRIQIIGVNGCQGSGKSTLADYLCTQVKSQYDVTAVALSMDDFYLTKKQRNLLARDVHPLLAVRGVPGTHDVELAIHSINSLKCGKKTLLARFDKSTDDRVGIRECSMIEGPVGLIVIEGWCFGATPEADEKLAVPINDLERQSDAEGLWRHFVNDALAGNYQTLFNMADRRVMLRAPSFDRVFHWRLEQEQKLAERLRLSNTEQAPSNIMTEDDIRHFISYFQRITEHCLSYMPEQVDHLYQLNESRAITHHNHLISSD